MSSSRGKDEGGSVVVVVVVRGMLENVRSGFDFNNKPFSADPLAGTEIYFFEGAASLQRSWLMDSRCGVDAEDGVRMGSYAAAKYERAQALFLGHSVTYIKERSSVESGEFIFIVYPFEPFPPFCCAQV